MQTIYQNGAALVGEELELWEDIRLTVEHGRIIRIERRGPDGEFSGGAETGRGGKSAGLSETVARGSACNAPAAAGTARQDRKKRENQPRQEAYGAPEELRRERASLDSAEENAAPAVCGVRREPCEVVDLQGAVLLPGLVNTHGHLPMTLLRGAGGGLPLQRWLSEVIFPLERELTEEKVALGARLALAEMIKSGTTAFADMYYFSPAIVRETLAAGLRGNIGRSVCSFDYEGDAAALPDFAEQRALFAAWNGAGGGQIRCDYVIHSVETCGERFIASAVAYAARDGAGLMCHLAETRTEVEQCLARYGRTPPQVFADCGAFDLARITAAHCVHLSEEDIELLAEKKVAVAHCPSSNLKLASGFAPVARYLRAGIPVTVGTDGAASNNNLNLMEELHLAALLAKAVDGDATALPAREALRMATSAGARALGFAETGVLREGMAADFIAVRRNGLHQLPERSIHDNLVYAAQAADVALTVAGGQILYDGALRTIDEERLRWELARTAW